VREREARKTAEFAAAQFFFAEAQPAPPRALFSELPFIREIV
jgi:hypothetical protein